MKRRHFPQTSGLGLGAIALASLESRASETRHLTGNAPAKRIIWLFMAGGPPHMDLFDHKPSLAEFQGKDLPPSVLGADFKPSGMSAGQARFTVLASPRKFARHGQSGRWVSDALPYTAQVVDELAMIHSMYSDAINHEPAIMLMNTCAMFPGRPSLGSWMSYGLGSMNANLPSFVVLNSNLLPGTSGQPVTPRLWSSSFLPTEHAGVALRSGRDPVLYLKNPEGMSPQLRRELVEGINEQNARTFDDWGDPETRARIAQYELAGRMQASVPELTDLSDEPESTWELYGPEAKTPGSFAHNCLMARRLAERGVRFTQVYQRGWDFHGGLTKDLARLCAATDRPAYALITDLKRRGLLDDTLVVWGGEFGRTVYSQGGDGRDHHARCFTTWLAGGGIKAGATHGVTDDFAFSIAKDPVHVRDLTTTLCHLLGIDAQHLSKRVLGVDLKPFGVEPGHLVKGILA